MIVTAVISVIVGLAVGVLSGLLGLGGGTILVPVFTVFFGLAPVAATGTSLFTIFFTSISGAIARIRAKTCVVKVGVALGLGGALTSPIGVYLATISPEAVVVLAVVAVILYSIGTTLRKLIQKPSKTGNLNGKDLAGNLSDTSEAINKNSFSFSLGLRSVLIGLLTGLLSGYVGLGGGFVMIPLMRNVLGFSMKLASGTSLMGILFIALSGSLAQISFGNVDFLVGLSVVVGSIPGAVIGGLLASRVKDKTLSILFIGFLLVATALLIAKEFGLLG